VRIIRTGRTVSEPLTEPKVSKGWVRQSIISGLSTQPSTVTELARRLGVSKSTASYHLSMLLSKGVVEIVDSENRKGKAQMKRYGLREGSYVTLLSRSDEEFELGRIRETFDLFALSWRRPTTVASVEQLQGLLYRMFLHMFRISRSEHVALMREYGGRAGAILASRMHEVPLKDALMGLTAEFARSGISDSDLMELPDSPIMVVVSNICIGSTFHPSNSCYFLEGMIEGAIRTKFSPGFKVERVTVPGLPSCLFAVGRVKRFDADWLADAILGSSSYAAINRRHQRG
jgi:DNA-binding transcriptional ArsR family regulator